MYTIFLISPKMEYLKNWLKILPTCSHYFSDSSHKLLSYVSLKFADNLAKNQFYTFLEFPDKM